MAKDIEWWQRRVEETLGKSLVKKPPRTLPNRMPDPEAEIQADNVQDQIGGKVPISYAPTKSINPQDPRTKGAGYDKYTQTLRVEWGDGGKAYNYYDVPPEVWAAFQRSSSPGKFINSVLNGYRYGPADV